MVMLPLLYLPLAPQVQSEKEREKENNNNNNNNYNEGTYFIDNNANY